MKALILACIMATSIQLAAQGTPCDNQPRDPAAMKSMTVSELEKAGDTCRAEKDYEQAIRFFNEALHKDKKNAKLYNKLGLAELSSGAYASAEADFAKATKYNRKYPEAWNDLGVVSYINKKYPAAVKYFSKALALDDTRPNFHVNLGITYFTLNQMDLAMQQYTRALQLDPDALVRSSKTGMSAQITDRDQRARQDFMMAQIYAKLGDVDKCLQCLEKAKEGGYSDLDRVYKEDDFSTVRQDARLASIVPPAAPPQ